MILRSTPTTSSIDVNIHMSASEQVESCVKTAATLGKGHDYSSPRMMRLNWDVLLQVMDALSHGDFSRMSRTCHTLLRRAPRKLLSRSGYDAILIRTFHHFVSFCLFMLGGRHDGFQYLTDLALRPRGGWCDQPKYGPLLATLLARATELRHFTLGDCEILELNQRVCRTLAEMPKLASLEVGNVGDRSFKHLKSLQIPALTNIEANFSYKDHVVDAIPVFEPFKDTLRKLNLHIVNIDTTGGVQYPLVRTLSIILCSGCSPSLLAKAFPGLRHFQLQSTLDGTGNDDEIAFARWFSIQDQQPPSPRWASLRTFNGSIADLYALALPCTVDHVGAAGTLSSEQDEERLAVAIGDVRPSSLCLRLQLPEFDLSSLPNHLAAARDRLTELQLQLDFEGDMHEYPMSQINDMLRGFSVYKLRVLEIDITWTPSPERQARRRRPVLILDEGDTPSEASSSSDSDDDEGPTPAELDFEAIAHRVMEYSKTLRFISLGDRWVRRAVFEVREEECAESKRRALHPLLEGSAGWEEFYDCSIYTEI